MAVVGWWALPYTRVTPFRCLSFRNTVPSTPATLVWAAATFSGSLSLLSFGTLVVTAVATVVSPQGGGRFRGSGGRRGTCSHWCLRGAHSTAAKRALAAGRWTPRDASGRRTDLWPTSVSRRGTLTHTHAHIYMQKPTPTHTHTHVNRANLSDR